LLLSLPKKVRGQQVVDDAEKKLLADVGKRIREARAAQGLSLEQLARLTGISAPALSLIETGKRDARLTTSKRIADALRLSLATLTADGLGTAEPSASSSAGGYDLGEYQ
jgi:HTH-type transcriptional regulator, competence development regulator